jgi:hypothetical protein
VGDRSLVATRPSTPAFPALPRLYQKCPKISGRIPAIIRHLCASRDTMGGPVSVSLKPGHAPLPRVELRPRPASGASIPQFRFRDEDRRALHNVHALHVEPVAVAAEQSHHSQANRIRTEGRPRGHAVGRVSQRGVPTTSCPRLRSKTHRT